MFQMRTDAQFFAGPAIWHDPELLDKTGVADDRIHRFGALQAISSDATN